MSIDAIMLQRAEEAAAEKKKNPTYTISAKELELLERIVNDAKLSVQDAIARAEKLVTQAQVEVLQAEDVRHFIHTLGQFLADLKKEG